MRSKALWTLGVLGTCCVMGGALVPGVSQAFESDEVALSRPRPLNVADLAGPWAISLGGNTGCGASVLYATTTLDTTGKGRARLLGKSTGCAPSDDPDQLFQITSLDPDGSGTANLSCGVGCGWELKIQIPRGNPSFFSVVDITPDNPDNTLVGTAAKVGPTIIRN